VITRDKEVAKTIRTFIVMSGLVLMNATICQTVWEIMMK